MITAQDNKCHIRDQQRGPTSATELSIDLVMERAPSYALALLTPLVSPLSQLGKSRAHYWALLPLCLPTALQAHPSLSGV